MSPAGTASNGERFKYQRHRPEQTLLYQLIECHYDEFSSLLAAQGTNGIYKINSIILSNILTNFVFILLAMAKLQVQMMQILLTLEILGGNGNAEAFFNYQMCLE